MYSAIKSGKVEHVKQRIVETRRRQKIEVDEDTKYGICETITDGI